MVKILQIHNQNFYSQVVNDLVMDDKLKEKKSWLCYVVVGAGVGWEGHLFILLPWFSFISSFNLKCDCKKIKQYKVYFKHHFYAMVIHFSHDGRGL